MFSDSLFIKIKYHFIPSIKDKVVSTTSLGIVIIVA